MSEDEVNPYELLSVEIEANEQTIRTAYRQRSLKVHPDRNPNNPDAARKFHELNQAYELLLDPLRRLALDAKLRIKEARKTRFKTYDNKRKVLVEELEEREKAFKKAPVEKQQEEVKRWHDTEQIKDEGRRLREEKEKELKAREMEKQNVFKQHTANVDMDEPPSIRTSVVFSNDTYSLCCRTKRHNRSLLSALFGPFGPTDTETIVLSLKPSKKAPNKGPKTGTALVPFKRIGDAFAVVCASGRPERGLNGVDIAWVGGKEPAIIGWLKSTGRLSSQPLTEPPQSQQTDTPTTFSSFPETLPDTSFPSVTSTSADIDYESLTLMRLRQAERERLEKEIREQEENE
ncbi:DnaJ-domain-containing protein [Hymenopellis radicata]|nr:DnaJ-domain-containing protein [Hymenopellis radicata]